VYPGLALARELSNSGWDLFFIGSPNGPESRLVPAAGFDFEPVKIIGRARGLSPRNLAAAGFLASATARSLSLLARFAPDVVVGTGGYASLPAIVAGALLRVPIVLHEQNSVPGLANRLGARFAKLVGVSFPGTQDRFSGRGRLTGNPVRPEIAALRTPERSRVREEGLAHFGLARGRKTLLVTGGSQGAASINKAVLGAYHLWRREEHLQILHLVGPRNIEEVESDLAAARGPDDRIVWRAVGYTDRMDLALAAADLALCRGGSTTIFELAAAELPAICVPYPHSIDEDQRRNAEAVSSKGGLEVVADGDLSSSLVTHKVESLIFDEASLEKMSKAIGLFYVGDAVSRLASLVEEAFFPRRGEPDSLEGITAVADKRQRTFPPPEGGKVHIVGIGGARNAPVAMLLLALGIKVTGSDREDSGTLVRLRELGIAAIVGHQADNINAADFVIYSVAVPRDNPELEAARTLGIPTMTGAQALARLTRDKQLVAVTGTHGKSTTTSMVVEILEEAGMDPTYVIGANLPHGHDGTPGGKLGSGPIAVVEADEAYGSFLELHPSVS
ncbi:MAG: glycosyltransferase, partial [Acidimicrobiia bacterium]